MNLFKILLLLSTVTIHIQCASKIRLPDTSLAQSEDVSPSPQKCRARARINMNWKDENVRGETILQFRYQKGLSTLDIRFLSPFGTQAGQLQITPEAALWRDSESSFPLHQHPVFSHWYQPSWWREVGFLLGLIPPPEENTAVELDQEGRARLYRHKGRTIICHPGRGPVKRSCEMRDQELEGKLNFTFFKCEEAV